MFVDGEVESVLTVLYCRPEFESQSQFLLFSSCLLLYLSFWRYRIVILRPLFWWRLEILWCPKRLNTGKPWKKYSQIRNYEFFWNLDCRCAILKKIPLLFSVKFEDYLKSPVVKLRRPCKLRYLILGRHMLITRSPLFLVEVKSSFGVTTDRKVKTS